MKLNLQIRLATVIVMMAVTLMSSCNKTLPDAEPIITPPATGSTILKQLDDPDFSILKAAVLKAGSGITSLLDDTTAVFTFFAPDNAAFQRSGIPSEAALAAFSPELLQTILMYHMIGGQKIMLAGISSDFPNMYLQSALVLSAPSPDLPPGYRMPVFPSKRGSTAWVNNVPIVEPDIAAANGVMHRVAALIAPPSRVLYERIHSDPDLAYLDSAISRADSGDIEHTTRSALSNPAANLTVFAPTNLAFQQILTGLITQALVTQGLDLPTASATASALAASPTVFQNPALFNALPAQTVKGLLFYHILGVRVFSVNIPSTGITVNSLLGAAYPGLALNATFGVTGVTAATVKGFANPSPSSILINPTPDPNGSSDQLFVNGTLHKIDQVLRLQ